MARSVNTAQVVANWLIGREIVEEEQKGKRRAGYGEQLLTDLSGKLKADGVPDYSVQNLRYMRQFFLAYPALAGRGGIRHAPRGESPATLLPEAIRHTLCDESWSPGHLHSNLSWTHYRTLLRVDKPEARAFYEIEAIQKASLRTPPRLNCYLIPTPKS